jgi:DNA topoisomerase VI subunit B
MPAQVQSDLKRQVFTTSREFEYFAEAELVTQTGYGKEYWWPLLLAKELGDNGLDAAEQAALSPVVKMRFSGDSFRIQDNGPGITADVITRVLDFSTRTSNKIAYVSPTRGAQGNALKTVLAVPFVLSGGLESVVTIESLGICHTIAVLLDRILKRPRIVHTTEQMVRKPGTVVQLSLHQASSQDSVLEAETLPKLLASYALFNPHATFELTNNGEDSRWAATTSDWRKWLPSDPTSAHWYDLQRLEDLIGAYISNGEIKLVRDFVAEFRGLSSTVKRKQVSAAADIGCQYLDDLAAGGTFDRAKLRRLLQVMQDLSAPVKPQALGILGQEHFEKRIKASGDTFRYARAMGIDDRNLPFCIEVAFGITGDETLRGQHIGLNWAVPLKNPLQEITFRTPDRDFEGLGSMLAHNHIDVDDDPVCFLIHLISPRFDFLDRGKGSVSLSKPVVEALATTILSATKQWAAIKKREYRQQRRDDRERQRYHQGRIHRVTIKEAAWAEMPAAYLKAGGNGHWPAHGRQIYYAARGAILKLTGAESLNADYFTQRSSLIICESTPNKRPTGTWSTMLVGISLSPTQAGRSHSEQLPCGSISATSARL